MSKAFELPIPYKIDEFSCQFPQKCVYCGKNPETQITINVRGSKEYQQSYKVNVTRSYNTNFLIPYCREHAELSKKNNRLIIVASIVGGLITAIAGRNAGGLITNAEGEPVSGFVNLVIALVVLVPVGGAISYLPLRFLLLPLFNKSIRHQHGFFQIGGALGISIFFKIEPYSGSVIFDFTNDDVAQEFSLLNSGSKSF